MLKKPVNQVCLGWRYQEIQGKKYMKTLSLWIGGGSSIWELVMRDRVSSVALQKRCVCRWFVLV